MTYSATIAASGGIPKVTAGALQVYMSMSSAVIISGTPTTAGKYSFTVTVTGSALQQSLTAKRSHRLFAKEIGY